MQEVKTHIFVVTNQKSNYLFVERGTSIHPIELREWLDFAIA